jgi:putative tryptophan/tyrosine transport system substrate-binding protein
VHRREFIAGLGGATWSVVALAQQGDRVRRVGFLVSVGSENDPVQQNNVAGLRNELAKLGWVDGGNLRIDVRFGGADTDRLRAAAMQLIGLAPDLIVCNGAPATTAVQQQTRTIPIVFVAVGDPVANGYVKNVARPEGNTTGVTNLFASIAGKWLELLREAAPLTRRVGIIYNAQLALESFLFSIDEAARLLILPAVKIPYRDGTDLENGIDALAAEPNGGLIVVPPTPNAAQRAIIRRLVAQYGLPSIYGNREFVSEGGLMAYGSRSVDLIGRAAYLADRILRGAKVSDLPVEFPTKFELVISLKAAKAIGLTISESFLLRADEVLE